VSLPAVPREARSLTRATLYRVAVGVALIVALSSGMTYHLLYREIEQRALEQLREYAAQRTEYHESRFALARAFHDVVKADFVSRYLQQLPDAERRFDELMSRYPDGAYRNSVGYDDTERYPTGWIHMRVQPDAEFKRRWMLFFDLSEHYSRLVTTRFTNFYLMHPTEPANMGYDDPERSGNVQWAALTPADYALDEREYFTAANAAVNPERQTVWAGPYLEPAYDKILVSALTPVYMEDEHIATIGSDDLVDDLEASILRSDIPGTSHTVFRKDGRLVVDPQYMDRIIESHDGFHISEANDRRLDALLALASQVTNQPLYGHAEDIDQYYAISRLQSTGWYFASTLPGQFIRAQAFQAAQWVLWIGLASFGLLLVSLAFILRRQVGRPLRGLLDGIRSTAAGELRAVPVTGSDELAHLASAFNAMVDRVSERDAALRVEKERFRALIEHAVDVICVVDAAGIVRYASPSLETVLGVLPETVIGRPLLDRVHADDRKRLTNVMQGVTGRAGRLIDRTEFRVHHADGTWTWMEATGTNQIDNPAVGGIVVNARDITGTKTAADQLARQREALRQSEKMSAMGALLAGVAHELNNPLAILMGRAALLESRVAEPAAKEASGKIYAAAERCGRIVRTFLSMARQRPPERRQTQLNDVALAALELLAYGLRSSGITTSTSFDPDLPAVNMDADQIGQVVVNLVVNAQHALGDRRDAATQTGEIRLSTRRAGNMIKLQVSDNGPGIPPELRERIFDPFFTTKPAGSGTGVGLAVSLAIAREHRGDLRLAPADSGATFILSLPLDSAEEVRAEHRRCAPEDELFAGHAVIVDDEVEVTEVLGEILESAGFTTTRLTSGRDAIAWLRDHDCDIILTDLRMPDLDGPALWRTLREERPELARRMAFITGDTLSATVEPFLKSTGLPWLEKPFTPEQVLELVARVESIRAERI
jgi:PAS domain S-box-containing protein